MRIDDYQKAKLIVEKIDQHYSELNKLYEIKNSTDHFRNEKVVISTTGSQAKIEFDPYFVDLICEVINSKIESLKKQLFKI